ncbi:hypothetical protein RHMOL_Rhmol11G0286700 [Rhododendron molle]|uniref:Uncharacterized protein n=2 Tax=Rhododendron molle TaxID=49168 RepID=A0ACC0LYE5_RHOML|nr:hypothetical protein RHMOL_Rhmol11G0286700 [Rhododendron molle]
MKLPSDASWTVRKLFSLRHIGHQFIKSKIGNGLSTFLWLDHWHNLGPLFHKFGDRVSFNLGRSLNAKVSSIIYQGGWRWPRLRNAAIREVIANTEGGLLPDISKEDEVVWTLTPNGCYSAKSAWMALRNRAPTVDWAHMVWHKQYVPRWSFILWVALLGRLSTIDRLMEWGVTNAKDCVLCYGGQESHSHLFFECQYATLVWTCIRSKCCRHGDNLSLWAEVQWGSHHCSKSVSTIIYQWCLAASEYFLWRERNSRIFRQVGVDSYTLVKRIEEEIRACLVSLKLSIRSYDDAVVCHVWGIPFGVNT